MNQDGNSTVPWRAFPESMVVWLAKVSTHFKQDMLGTYIADVLVTQWERGLPTSPVAILDALSSRADLKHRVDTYQIVTPEDANYVEDEEALRKLRAVLGQAQLADVIEWLAKYEAAGMPWVHVPDTAEQALERAKSAR